MPNIASSLGTTQSYIPAVNSTQIGKFAGLHMHFPTVAAFQAAVLVEQGNITASSPLWATGQLITCGGEPVSVFRNWVTTSGGHARNVTIRPGLVVTLVSDTAQVRANAGIPGVGIGVDGDISVDYAGDNYYTKAAGAWSLTGTISTGVNTFAALTDKISVDLPAINTALSTALATKVAALTAVALTGNNTLTQTSHFNRHLSWTGASAATQTISSSASPGDVIECTNDGTGLLTFSGATATAGYKLTAAPGETFQAVYTNGVWISQTIIGTGGSPIKSFSANYTLVISDAGYTLLHPVSDSTARTLTIPANSSVPFPDGTSIMVDNESGAGTITIQITADTLVQTGSAGTLGNISLTTGQRAVLQKIGPTKWKAMVTADGSAVAWGAISGTLASQSDLVAALGLKAPLANPVFTGTPAAPTAAAGTATTQLATTAFTTDAVSITPIVSFSADTTLVLTNKGATMLHPASDTSARALIIPANSSVPFPLGTVISIRNQNSAGAVNISINSDILTKVGAAGGTGSRTLAAGGEAMLLKETATGWSIRGTAELT